ncbi:MAG: hypothetical protein V3V84_02460 [Candidatus Bathyarchaeia archaeon]
MKINYKRTSGKRPYPGQAISFVYQAEFGQLIESGEYQKDVAIAYDHDGSEEIPWENVISWRDIFYKGISKVKS